MTTNREALLARLVGVVGARRVLTDPRDTEGYQRDWRDRYRGAAVAVILPGSADEVAALVRVCRDLNVAIVPQGGNTGLTGGAIAQEDRPSVLINLSRVNRIRRVDTRNNSLVAEAGCILANVRAVAEEHDRLFPLLLGSVGSCEIGGLVSTNAGGTGVLRYGNMRELVLGLEVILPNGAKWDGLRALRKDNTGYDLKQLFIGAEGTLGIVTAAVLKLFPRPTASATAMVSMDTVEQAIDLLRFMQAQIGGRIDAFEVMSKLQLEIVLTHGPDLRCPMPLESPWYVLIEIADSAPDWDPVTQLEKVLQTSLDRGMTTNAVVATDLSKVKAVWDLRHNISEANKRAGFTVSNDTSVPISRLPEFVDKVSRRLSEQITGAQVCHCGHIGDGNVHVIAILPRGLYQSNEQCERAAAAVNLIVHEESVGLGGSISAEHGIGAMHIDRLERFKAALDLTVMRAIKDAFDPQHIMNPGKILRDWPRVGNQPSSSDSG